MRGSPRRRHPNKRIKLTHGRCTLRNEGERSQLIRNNVRRTESAFAIGEIVDELLGMFAAGATGHVARKQTTFWDLGIASQEQKPLTRVRIHFSQKTEFRYPHGSFSTLELSDTHPLLPDYREAHASIYLARQAADPPHVLAQLELVVERVTHGWRNLSRYANPLCDPLVLLRDGHGKLLEAPITLAARLSAVLEEDDVRFTVLKGSHVAGSHLKALTLGDGFVVAHEFGVERLTSD
jgi:hypothetical protein